MATLISAMRLSVFLWVATLTLGTPVPDSSPLYKDPTASIEQRVEDLMKRMTIKEKVKSESVTQPPCRVRPFRTLSPNCAAADRADVPSILRVRP